MTLILAVANQKGGVAKTTTAVALGGALASMGMDVLLVDLDPQGNLTLSLGSNPLQNRHSVADGLINSANLRGACQETIISGVDLIPSNPEMELIEQLLPIRSNYQTILRTLLNDLAIHDLFDYIILDCPPAVGSILSNALNAADLLIIPTQPEYFSVFALKNMFHQVKAIRDRGNSKLVYRILITMKDRRNRIHRDLTEQLQNSFPGGVFSTCIETDTKVRESAIVGLPITHYAPKSRAAIQYYSLAEELLEYVKEKNSQST